MLSSLVTPNSREKQYIINNKGGTWNDRSSWRIQRRAKRKGRKVTYKTNGPNKKKKGGRSKLKYTRYIKYKWNSMKSQELSD